MKRVRMTEEEARRQYWAVVECCLREFHRKSPAWVAEAVNAAKPRVGNLPGRAEELYYHAEPFDVACRIAGQELDLKVHLERYLEMRDREA